MKCKLVENTIPSGDTDLDNKDENQLYTRVQVKKERLLEARIAKQHKYIQIKEKMTQWLENYKTEIKLKYGVDNILVEDFYLVVSSLGELLQETETDFGNLLHFQDGVREKL
jgi:hypothetical protein